MWEIIKSVYSYLAFLLFSAVYGRGGEVGVLVWAWCGDGWDSVFCR